MGRPYSETAIRRAQVEAGERLSWGYYTRLSAAREIALGLAPGPLRTIVLSATPPPAGHRPSASVMFALVAEHFGSETYAVMLTGMGRDGVAGLGDAHRAGGRVVAQDEATSVVFGMPKAAIDAGVVDAVLPLDAIAAHVARAVAR